MTTPEKPTTRPSARSAVTRLGQDEPRDHGHEERRGVEQHGRDRRPGAGGRLGEAGEGERRAAQAHGGGESPQPQRARQPGAERAQEREQQEEAEHRRARTP